MAPNLALLVVFRFVAGSVQGAFFGAGAVVAAYVYGPGKGGRAFATVMGGLTIATIFGAPLEHLDRSARGVACHVLGRGRHRAGRRRCPGGLASPHPGPPRQFRRNELGALRRLNVW